MSESDNDSYQEYWGTIDRLALVLYQVDSFGDSWVDLLHELVDGNYWVIYTHAASKALIYSDNTDSYFEQGLDPAHLGDSYGKAACTMAYFAMTADLTDRVSSLMEAGGPDA